MNGVLYRVTFSLVAITVISTNAAAMASEPTPEEVLKGQGLTKAGLLFVLDAEQGFLDGMAKIQPRYAELEVFYQKISAVVANQDAYDELDREYAVVTQQYRDVGAEINAFPTTSNSELKQQYRNLLDLEKQLSFRRNELNAALDLRYKTLTPDWKREELIKDFQAKRQEFLTTSRGLRAQGDEVIARYVMLAKDNAVKGALSALGNSTKTKVELGPSPEFKKKSTLLKNAERMLSPETSRRKTRAKKSNQKTNRNPSATTGTSGPGTN